MSYNFGGKERERERGGSACVRGILSAAGPGNDHYDFGQDVLFCGSTGVASGSQGPRVSGKHKVDKVNLAKLLQDYRPELVPKGCIHVGNGIHTTRMITQPQV